MTRRVFLALAMILSLFVVVAPRAAMRGVDVAARLTDAQFWQTVEGAGSGRNLVSRWWGDFAGPKSIRAVGRYLKAQGATVTAFYLSNVEQYLTQNGVWPAFCQNFAT